MGDAAAAAADVKELLLPRKTFLVPAIKPFDHYDFARAKIACNVAWLVAKAFGTGKEGTAGGGGSEGSSTLREGDKRNQAHSFMCICPLCMCAIIPACGRLYEQL